MNTALRIAVIVAGLASAATAQANWGTVSTTGWWSVLGAVGVAGLMWWVVKKID